MGAERDTSASASPGTPTLAPHVHCEWCEKPVTWLFIPVDVGDFSDYGTRASCDKHKSKTKRLTNLDGVECREAPAAPPPTPVTEEKPGSLWTSKAPVGPVPGLAVDPSVTAEDVRAAVAAVAPRAAAFSGNVAGKDFCAECDCINGAGNRGTHMVYAGGFGPSGAMKCAFCQHTSNPVTADKAGTP